MNSHDWAILLDRYVHGECSPDEQAVVRQELVRRGAALDVIDALREASERAAEAARDVAVGSAVPSTDVAEALARLDRRFVAAGLRPAPTPRLSIRLERSGRRPHRWPIPRYGFRAAAVAGLLLAGAAAAAWLTWPARESATRAVSAGREIKTARGQRALVQLIDGSEVMVGVDSRLHVPANYGVASREVSLDGEAYFTVVHDPAHPFVVRTAHTVARDVGTKFGVQAYPTDETDRIVVAEGAVTVAATAAAHARLVEAGQRATVSPAGAVALARVNVRQELAWTRGELRFTNAPLAVAIRRLGQWYDLDISLSDASLADRPVSGIYAGEPVDQVLTLIGAAVGARVERHGKRVFLSASIGEPAQ